MHNKKMNELIQETINFLNTSHDPGKVFHVFLSTSEKEYWQKCIEELLVEKKYRIVAGVFKPGHLEHDYYLEKE